VIRIITWLVAVSWLLPAAVDADPRPAKGTLLVATELVQGELFAKTVVLLLHYDETGAFGLVVNRPTDVTPGEVLAEEEAVAGYSGTLFWGGPVHMDSLRALLLTDDPPEEAEKITASVYLVSFEDALGQGPADPAVLRLFIGYAGWAPGQLDYEMARGSWRVLPATGELVFAEAPEKLWQRLAPAQEQRATVEPGAILSPGDTCEPEMRVGGQWSHGNT
jgi:putative transcriptional regulator